jgi:YVTN family beta-propeller protein
LELHQETLYEIANHNTPSNETSGIPVGKHPTAIGIKGFTNKIYVANYDDGTVSVINGTNNTKIGKDIPVGKNPKGIGANIATNTIYVTNQGDNTVSVINGYNNIPISLCSLNRIS